MTEPLLPTVQYLFGHMSRILWLVTKKSYQDTGRSGEEVHRYSFRIDWICGPDEARAARPQDQSYCYKKRCVWHLQPGAWGRGLLACTVSGMGNWEKSHNSHDVFRLLENNSWNMMSAHLFAILPDGAGAGKRRAQGVVYQHF